MKLLLAFAALLTPVLATAQTPIHLYVHPHLYTLRPSAPLYRSLSDTVAALATQLDPGQIVSARASNDIRWALVSNILGNLDADAHYKLISKTGTGFTGWYVRREALITLPDIPAVKAVITKRRLLSAGVGGRSAGHGAKRRQWPQVPRQVSVATDSSRRY